MLVWGKRPFWWVLYKAYYKRILRNTPTYYLGRVFKKIWLNGIFKRIEKYTLIL